MAYATKVSLFFLLSVPSFIFSMEGTKHFSGAPFVPYTRLLSGQMEEFFELSAQFVDDIRDGKFQLPANEVQRITRFMGFCCRHFSDPIIPLPHNLPIHCLKEAAPALKKHFSYQESGTTLLRIENYKNFLLSKLYLNKSEALFLAKLNTGRVRLESSLRFFAASSLIKSSK